MNKTNNKRYQLTDVKIENALIKLLKDKDFNSIYVNDICKEAGIARTSFYSHYDDINDLILKIQDKYSKDIIDILMKNKLSSKDAFTKYFYYLKDHSYFYKVYLMSPENSIFKKNSNEPLFALYSNLFENKNKNEREINYNMIFIAAGIKGISYKWLLDGCIETPEKMTEILHREYSGIISHE